MKHTYLLVQKQGRFGEQHPHFRYKFHGMDDEKVTEQPQGVVLEMPGIVGLPVFAGYQTSPHDADLSQYQPEEVP